MNERLAKEIRDMAGCIRDEKEPVIPSEEVLMPLYQELLLSRRRTAQRINQLAQAAKERDSFYSDIQKIRAEHHMAEKIQRSLLPVNFSEITRRLPVALHADMDTAWEVGGDYYDFFALGQRRLFFSIADVSGKSVSAAMFGMMSKTMMNLCISEGKDLAQACEEISRRLYQSQSGGSRMFVTLWAGVLDATTGEVEYVNAGHEAPILIKKDGGLERLSQLSGLPLSAYFNQKHPEKSRYQKHSTRLSAGDTLLLYTDGLTDSENRDGRRFGIENVAEALRRCEAARQPVEECVRYLLRGIVTHASHGDREDDITVLGIRYLGAPARQTESGGEPCE